MPVVLVMNNFVDAFDPTEKTARFDFCPSLKQAQTLFLRLQFSMRIKLKKLCVPCLCQNHFVLIEEYDISRYQGLVKVDNVALDVDSTTEWCRTKKLVLSSNEIP
jgi:hypothetical protein